MSTTVETRVEDSVGQPYRAKDITMGATVHTASRTVFLTGAIDTNERDILVRVELPDAGIWHVVKSETNLTDSSWGAWQITLGEGTHVVPNPEGRVNLSQQFSRLYIADSGERFCFYEGEIRPGEAILKQFTLDTKIPRIVMSHIRPAPMALPAPVENRVPSEIVEGFEPKPHIESWITPRVV